MTEEIAPVAAVTVTPADDRRRGSDRREPADLEPGPKAAPPENSEPAEPAPEGLKAGPSEFYAQLLGGGPRRGLKGGPEVLDDARSTYLAAEYSGPADRRPKKGTVKREV